MDLNDEKKLDDALLDLLNLSLIEQVEGEDGEACFILKD
jgi:hypothetical protein